VVVEQFGTLESLYPGRIDLGVGRSSGSVGESVARALRSTSETRERFPDDLREMQSLFRPFTPDQALRAVPGAGLEVPIWVLGSSTFSAREAAMLGLPFAFGSHVNPDSLGSAIEIYRSNFTPSVVLGRPYVMACVIVTAADTDETAHYLFSSLQQLTVGQMRNTLSALIPPMADVDAFATADEQRALTQRSWRHAVTGSMQTVQRRIEPLIDQTAIDELKVLSLIHDLDARYRSFELLSEVRNRIHARERAR
jgi:luciferase family oxidoreductase group 1